MIIYLHSRSLSARGFCYGVSALCGTALFIWGAAKALEAILDGFIMIYVGADLSDWAIWFLVPAMQGSAAIIVAYVLVVLAGKLFCFYLYPPVPPKPRKYLSAGSLKSLPICIILSPNVYSLGL